MRPHVPFTPLGMKAKDAARYLGVSETKLRTLPIDPRQDGGNLLYDQRDLENYFNSLPYKTKAAEGNTCDGIFG